MARSLTIVGVLLIATMARSQAPDPGGADRLFSGPQARSAPTASGSSSSSSGSSSASKSPSFRPQAGPMGRGLTLNAPGLTYVLGGSRGVGFAGLLGLGRQTPTVDRSATLQRIRNQQAMRAQQLAQLQRAASAQARHGAAHVLTIGFPIAGFKAPVPLDPKMTARLENFKTRTKMDSLEVTMHGTTAIATGRAKSSHDRNLLSSYLLLEPGIHAVDNQVVVSPPGL